MLQARSSIFDEKRGAPKNLDISGVNHEMSITKWAGSMNSLKIKNSFIILSYTCEIDNLPCTGSIISIGRHLSNVRLTKGNTVTLRVTGDNLKMSLLF